MINENKQKADALVNQGFEFIKQGDYNKALELFFQAADLGHPAAMHNISVSYNTGNGVPLDKAQAFLWMRKAAEQGFSLSCDSLAEKYCFGDGVDMDLDQALYWENKAVTLDPANTTYQEHLKEIQDKVKNFNTDPDVLLQRGLQAYQQKQFEQARDFFTRSAQKRNVQAMYNVSVMHFNGEGGPQNLQASYNWMKSAADAGHPDACYILAGKYVNGLGTVIHLDQAILYARKAVELNPQNPDYAEYLRQIEAELEGRRNGTLTWWPQGETFTADVVFFRDNLFRAEIGDPAAMHNTAICYLRGNGTEKDLKKSFEWLKCAADAGFAQACQTIINYCLMGWGTGRNPQMALMYAKKAAQLEPDNEAYQRTVINLEEAIRKPEELRIKKGLTNGISYQEVTELVEEGRKYYDAKQYDKALQFYLKAAKKGDSRALSIIGSMCLNGQGIEKNSNTAQHFLHAAASRGEFASLNLFTMKYTAATLASIWKWYRYLKGNLFDSKLMANQAVTTAGEKIRAALEAQQLQKRGQRHSSGKNCTQLLLDAQMTGLPDAYCAAAQYYEDNNNTAMAVYEWKLAAIGGHSYALYKLGLYYNSIDREVSEACFRAAAERGYKAAELYFDS